MPDFAAAPFPWQRPQWEYLMQRQRNNTLPHALLVSGTQGLGQYEFALAFAKQILCEQSQLQDSACGNCRSCLLIHAGNHPDIYYLQPEAAGKQIRIDKIRETIQQLNQTSFHHNYKIILIQPADALNRAASNALLKNLEEPTAKTLFMLIAHEHSQISATIRSRCQIIQFKPPSQELAKNWLQPLLKKKQNPDLLLSLAENAPLQALALAYEERLQERELLFDHLREINEKKSMPLQIATKWLKFDVKELLTALINIIIDCIRIKMGLPNHEILNKDKTDFIKQIAAKITTIKLFAYLDELYHLRQQLNQSATLNQQLLTETLFCKWNDYADCSS